MNFRSTYEIFLFIFLKFRFKRIHKIKTLRKIYENN